MITAELLRWAWLIIAMIFFLAEMLTAGFVLLVVAWPLRVLPALVGDTPGEAAQGLMALAGVLTMAALVLTATVCVRTAVITGRPVQQILRAMPV
mgnify:CR=1 FL=1